MSKTIPLFFALLLASLVNVGARAGVDQSDLLPIDQAFVLSSKALSADQIELRWKIADGYYLYRQRTGVDLLEPKTVTLGELRLPPGKKHTDEFFGEVETYRGELIGIQQINASSDAGQIQLQVKYQGCADLGICYPPHRQTITVALPATATAVTPPADEPLLGNRTSSLLSTPSSGSSLLGDDVTITGKAGLPLPEDQAFNVDAIATSPQQLLVRFTPAPGYYLYRDRSSFKLVDTADAALGKPQWPAGQNHSDPHFGDVIVYFKQVEVPIALTRSTTQAMKVNLQATFQGCQSDGICYPPMRRNIEINLPAGGTASSIAGFADNQIGTPPNASAGFDLIAFIKALLGGIGGGLILNLMPCVLPILSLKALSLANSGESPKHARKHALWYSTGVLLSFAAIGAAALALREAGLALGWGFQLQQPAVVALLALVMFAIGLSLSGVFQLGGGLAGVGQSLTAKTGPAGDFFTGVLAVVVAAPCTAPLMGAALTYAFTAPPVLGMTVFLALGLGLALPFLLIGFIPGLAKRLPKPGAWMETLKQILAFPMYLTAVWLLWVLAKQRGADAAGWLLVAAVTLAFGLWAWEQNRFGKPVLRAAALVIALAALWPVWRVQQIAPIQTADAAVSTDGAIAYAADKLQALRDDQRVVFVNMTADWCVTCKANERAVLDTDAFRNALTASNAVYMKGDWTNVDPQITEFLQQHNAVGVPLYVVYPKNGGIANVLPSVLTISTVEQALLVAAQ